MDKVAAKLSGWNGRNLTRAGRVSLTKSVLSSQHVYLMTVIKPPKEVIHELDKTRKCFLWAGDKTISSGKCKVNWTKTTLPKDPGGLGVLNLHKFARALRLRWLWQEWTAPEKAWVGMEVPCDDANRLLFANFTRITLGDGAKASFWHSGWLQGRRPKDIAPLLYAKSARKKRTVAQALHDTNWIQDFNFRSGMTTTHILEYTSLWNLVDRRSLQPQHEDTITWTSSTKGEYSTSSAYRAQFSDFAPSLALAMIRKTCAPQSVNSSLGSSCKTAFGLLTDSLEGTGTTALSARSAETLRRRHYILWLIADTHAVSGPLWPRGLARHTFSPPCGGPACRPWNGGLTYLRHQMCHAKAHVP
jgi:hypothetical protein